MHGQYCNAAHALGAHHWSSHSSPSVFWCMQQGLEGPPSQPGYNILKFSEAHMGADIICHSLLDSIEEGGSFCLGHSPFPFVASRHRLHMHLQGFGSQGCKDVSEVVLAVRLDAVEEEPVLQGTLKYGERVVCIFRVSVIDGQADGCCSSCQCTSNGINCGLGRLGDQLLQGQFWGHVLDPGWSDNGQIRKDKGGGYKNGYIVETVSPICLILDSTSMTVSTTLCSSGKGVQVMMTSWQALTMMWHHKNGKIQSFSCSYYHSELTNDKQIYSLLCFSVLLWFAWMSSLSLLQCTKQCPKEARILYSSLLYNEVIHSCV